MATKKLSLVTAVVIASSLFAGDAFAHHRPDHNGGGKPSPSPSDSPSPEPTEEPTPEPSPSPTEEPTPQDPKTCQGSDTSGEARPYPYFTEIYVAECQAVARTEKLAASAIFLPPPAYPYFCILGCGLWGHVPGAYPGWGQIVVEVEASDGTRTEVCRQSGVPPVTCGGVVDVAPNQPVRCLVTGETYQGIWITRLELFCG